MELSEKINRYRTDRPDEWTMDEFARDAKQLESSIMEDKIIQVSGFAVGPPEQHAYLLVGVTDSGQVVISQGDGDWAEAGPQRNKTQEEVELESAVIRRAEELEGTDEDNENLNEPVVPVSFSFFHSAQRLSESVRALKASRNV